MQTLFIEPGSPWENGYVESFNGKLRDELLDREIFYTLTEAKILIERWRRQYNTVRPFSGAGLSAAGSGSHEPSATERTDHEPSSLIRTGSTLGGGSVWDSALRSSHGFGTEAPDANPFWVFPPHSYRSTKRSLKCERQRVVMLTTSIVSLTFTLACGGESSPTAPSPPSRASITVSVTDETAPVPGTNLNWSVNFTVTVRETAGVSVILDRLLFTAIENLVLDADDITLAAGTNQVSTNGILLIPLGVEYSPGPAVTTQVLVEGTDQMGNSIRGSTVVSFG